MLVPIVINGELKLRNESDTLIVKIRVPEKNMQNMLNETKGRLLSKVDHEVSFNHNAGKLFMCEVIIGRLSTIKRHLSKHDGSKVDGMDEFRKLYDTRFAMYSPILTNEITGLYLYGDCSSYGRGSNTTFYHYTDGRVIRLNNNERTDNGNKRYVRNNGKWLSNKAF